MPPPFHIGLFIAERIGRSRDFLFGAYRYAGIHRHLQIHRISRQETQEANFAHIQSGEFDAVIYPMVHEPLSSWIRETGLPCISYHRNASEEGVTSVCVDDVQVGRMAADYFLNLQLKNFAYTGTSGAQYSRRRAQGYREKLCAQGFTVQEHELYTPPEERDLWLQSLPTPCGLFVSWDKDAAHASRIIQGLGVRVPDEIAILGTDNDRLECQSVHPPLSTIELPSEKLGFEAMRRIDLQLQKRPEGRQSLTLPPLRVVERQSTRLSLIENPLLQKALRFIQENNARPIRVQDVCTHSGSNRRSLETQFRTHLNRTILEEIQHQHIRKARDLLLNPEIPIKAVASLSGFNSSSRFCKVFEQYTGSLPSVYRQQRTILSPE